MALIQWKQINPELNGNGQLTGSLEISGSIILNGVNLSAAQGGGGGVLPSGVVSGSKQIEAQGFAYSSSVDALQASITSLILSSSTYLTSISGSNIQDLANIDITNIVNGQILAYNSQTGLFEPTSAGQGDITAVYSGVGLEGGGTEGVVALEVKAGDGILANSSGVHLDTGSAHFIAGVNTHITTLSASIEQTILNLSSSSDIQRIALSSSLTAYADAKFNSLVDGAPDLLNTLNELAAAIGDDQNISSSLVASIADKASNTQLTEISASLASSISSISTDFNDITNKPTLISSSAQIAADISGSTTALSASIAAELANIVHTDISALDTFTGSADTRITSLEAFSSSLDATYATDQQLINLSSSVTAYTDAKFASLVDGAPELLDTLNELAAAIGDDQNISSSLVTSLAGKASNTELSNVSASLAATISSIPKGIDYISGSDTTLLSEIEVLDYDNNVATVFQDGKLKFIFGEPALPASLNASISGFSTDRFNKQLDSYSVNASWGNGGYTLISASLYKGSTLLTEVGTGTSLSFSENTSGSHSYTLYYTASSPLDGNIYTNTDYISGNLNKSQPSSPSISSTATVQLGASSNQIEQGATGTIDFTTAYGSANNWEEVSLVNTPAVSPITVSGGSSSESISVTANYRSPDGLNDPQLTTSRSSSRTYSKIRSVRFGASAVETFTQAELEDLASWDTSLGGDIGTIDKGNTNPSGDSVTIAWSGDKYHYIVFDASRSNLSNITTSGFGVLGSFAVTTVGDYKIYKTTTLQAGGAGSSITYTLA
jgi:hypothetical protein